LVEPAQAFEDQDLKGPGTIEIYCRSEENLNIIIVLNLNRAAETSFQASKQGRWSIKHLRQPHFLL